LQIDFTYAIMPTEKKSPWLYHRTIEALLLL